MDRTLVVKAIERHARDYNLKVTAIGQMAVSNRHAYSRLLSGTAHDATARRVMAWIEGDRASRCAAAAPPESEVSQ